jgi:hypothetical protein
MKKEDILLLEDIYELLCGVGLNKKEDIIARINLRTVQLRKQKETE